MTFRAQNKSRIETKIISENWRGPIQPGGEDVWSDIQMFIPPVPPSKLIYCTIIEIEYILQVK